MKLTVAAFTALLAFALTVTIASAGDTIRSGTWQKKQYDAKGSWTIEKDGKDRYLVFSDDFRTKRGPDLKVFLSPKSLDDLSGKNATQKSLRVGELEKHRGAQRMKLPRDADLSKYRSIAIHCEEYAVLFAASSL